MIAKLSRWVDQLSTFFAHRKGLLPLIGMALILLNLIFQFLPVGWLASTNLCLHIGLLVALFGVMLAWAL